MKGEVIAFISAPGVGTSFLTRQMACKNMLPGFFEGEDGIFTPSILSVLNNENDSFERYEWLAGRTKLMLERAHRIAKSGIVMSTEMFFSRKHGWLQKSEISHQYF